MTTMTTTTTGYTYRDLHDTVRETHRETWELLLAAARLGLDGLEREMYDDDSGRTRDAEDLLDAISEVLSIN